MYMYGVFGGSEVGKKVGRRAQALATPACAPAIPTRWMLSTKTKTMLNPCTSNVRKMRDMVQRLSIAGCASQRRMAVGARSFLASARIKPTGC